MSSTCVKTYHLHLLFVNSDYGLLDDNVGNLVKVREQLPAIHGLLFLLILVFHLAFLRFVLVFK